MSVKSKRLLGIALALVSGAGVFLGITKLPNPGESGTNASASHPPIAAMDGAFGDRETLEAALAQNPTHVPVLVRLGQMALDSGDAAAAVRHLEEAVQIEPTNNDALLELGRALYQTGDADRAIEATQRILETQPNNVDALYNLGAIYANRDQLDEAREYWTRAVSAGPGTTSGTQAQQGLSVLNGQTATSSPGTFVHPPIPGTQTTSSGVPASASGNSKDVMSALLEFVRKN